MQHLKGLVCELERQKEEERVRVEEGEEGREGGWKEVRETVRGALHQSPLSEDEYLSLRGSYREGAEEEEWEKDMQSLADYVRVSSLFSL